eukprot:g5447.t1
MTMIALLLALPALAAAASSCTDANFPTDFTGKQVAGLTKHSGVANADACRAACCAQSVDSCEVFQWIDGSAPIQVTTTTAAAAAAAAAAHSHSLDPGCWLGKTGPVIGTSSQIVSRGRTPPPAPPQSTSYAVDDTKPLGLRWEGVGAISGGGATTKLLMDYEPAVASDILDFLFKPGFGLDLDILKVEMGGDTDSTEGAEPSHMHADPAVQPPNYDRGYE